MQGRSSTIQCCYLQNEIYIVLMDFGGQAFATMLVISSSSGPYIVSHTSSILGFCAPVYDIMDSVVLVNFNDMAHLNSFVQCYLDQLS